jgi:hypothetical protein
MIFTNFVEVVDDEAIDYVAVVDVGVVVVEVKLNDDCLKAFADDEVVVAVVADRAEAVVAVDEIVAVAVVVVEPIL